MKKILIPLITLIAIIIGFFLFGAETKNSDAGLDAKIGVEIPPSTERAALMALFIENPELINRTIIEGLKEGNRLKVYNEIKTGLNPTNNPKVQAKRDEIAELFGGGKNG